MKKFLLLHVGFERPTPEIMEKWMGWFKSIAPVQVDQGGFRAGKEITKEGTQDLAWGLDCLTGYNVIQAESMEEACRIAAECPFITGIRVYELRQG